MGNERGGEVTEDETKGLDELACRRLKEAG